MRASGSRALWRIVRGVYRRSWNWSAAFRQEAKICSSLRMTVGLHSPTNPSNECFSLANCFFGFCEGDQLVPRRLCSTVPRLIEIRHGGARGEERQYPFLCGSASSEPCGTANPFECCGAVALQFFADHNNFLHLFGKSIHGWICVLPGINEGLRIEWAHQLANLFQLKQFG